MKVFALLLVELNNKKEAFTMFKKLFLEVKVKKT